MENLLHIWFGWRGPCCRRARGESVDGERGIVLSRHLDEPQQPRIAHIGIAGKRHRPLRKTFDQRNERHRTLWQRIKIILAAQCLAIAEEVACRKEPIAGLLEAVGFLLRIQNSIAHRGARTPLWVHLHQSHANSDSSALRPDLKPNF